MVFVLTHSGMLLSATSRSQTEFTIGPKEVTSDTVLMIPSANVADGLPLLAGLGHPKTMTRVVTIVLINATGGQKCSCPE